MPSRLSAYALLYASMSLVGIYVALSKPLTAAFPVFLLATLRFAIAVPAMLPWLRRVPGEAPLERADMVRLLWQSVFGNFLFSICMLYGVKLSSATAAGIMLSLLPAMVALLSWIWLRERPGPRVIAAIVLAAVAILVINFARVPADAYSEAGSGHPLLGNLLLLGTVFCEAVYVVLGKQLSERVSARRISAILNLVGLALMTPLGVYAWSSADGAFSFAAISSSQWLLLVFYALAASQWSVWLWMTGARAIPASQAGVFTVALPIASTAVGVLALGERLTLAHGAAFACAAAGVLLIATQHTARH